MGGVSLLTDLPWESSQPCLREVAFSVSQDKLEQEEFRFVSTEEEREEISRKLSEASGWMEEEGYTATTKVGAFEVLLQSLSKKVSWPCAGHALCLSVTGHLQVFRHPTKL